MRSSRRGNLLLCNPLARGECAVRILFYIWIRTGLPDFPLAYKPAVPACRNIDCSLHYQRTLKERNGVGLWDGKQQR